MPMVTLRRNMEPTIVKKLPYDFPAVHGYTLHIFCVRRNAFTMQAVFPGRGPHTMQTLGKGVHSVAPRGGTSFLQALFLAGVLLWPPWAGCHWGLNRIASPGGRVAFFVINGVDLPLTFPAAGTGRLTLPLFFVVYTVNQGVNFPPAGHGGRRVTSVVAPCVFFWGVHPATTPATLAAHPAGGLFCVNPAACPAVPRDDARHQCRQNGHERCPRF